MEPGHLLLRRPRAFFRAPHPAAGTNEYCVPCTDVNACALLPGVQILGIDRSAGFEILYTLQAWQVDQHASRENAFFVVRDAEFVEAFSGRRWWKTVIGFPGDRHVAER